MARRLARASPAWWPACSRARSRLRSTRRIAPTTRRCSSRSGTALRLRRLLWSAVWRDAWRCGGSNNRFWVDYTKPLQVMPALVAGIHVFGAASKTWMAGTSPAMTNDGSNQLLARDGLGAGDQVRRRRVELGDVAGHHVTGHRRDQ